LLIGGGVVLVLLTAVGIGIWLIIRALAAPGGVVEDYLADVQAGRYDAAHARLCDSAQAQVTVAEITEQWEQSEADNGAITGSDVTGVHTEKTLLGTFRTVTVELQHGSSGEQVVRFSVGKVDDEYCMLSY
jgi:hypothetical protein